MKRQLQRKFYALCCEDTLKLGTKDVVNYWRDKKDRFWGYLTWSEGKLCNLDDITSVYTEIDEVNERWAKDLISIDNDSEEDAENEIDDIIMEVLDLADDIEKRFGTYKTLLEWAKEHPGEHDECLEFYFPNKSYIV